jgi:CheY-like chemotaxis protein
MILIVDDIATNRKLLRAILEAAGHATLEAADGVEALRLLQREHVTAVISDILMPNMDGFRFCLEVRKDARLRTLPFIFYTSTYTSLEDVRLGETMGADKYLTKPAPGAVILAALREAMERPTSSPVHAAPAAEAELVLQQYNQALVNKLSEKNTELQATLETLERAHERILRLNSDLEDRVRARTATLEATNFQLSQALSEVKQLNELLPICSYCKKIRDGKDYWQSVEGYISEHTNATFSHGICPGCVEKHLAPSLQKLMADRATREANKGSDL